MEVCVSVCVFVCIKRESPWDRKGRKYWWVPLQVWTDAGSLEEPQGVGRWRDLRRGDWTLALGNPDWQRSQCLNLGKSQSCQTAKNDTELDKGYLVSNQYEKGLKIFVTRLIPQERCVLHSPGPLALWDLMLSTIKVKQGQGSVMALSGKLWSISDPSSRMLWNRSQDSSLLVLGPLVIPWGRESEMKAVMNKMENKNASLKCRSWILSSKVEDSLTYDLTTLILDP